MSLLTAVKAIYIYDLVLSTLALIGFGLIIGLHDDADIPPWLILFFLVLLPRLVNETIFMAKRFNHVWAKITFVTRLITLGMFFIILTMEIVIKTAVEDEDFALEDSLPIIIIVGVILVTIDIYFTLMYYQFWKQSDRELGMSSRGQNGQQKHPNKKGVQGVTRVVNMAEAFASITRKPTGPQQDPGMPSMMTYNLETEMRNGSNDASKDDMIPRQQNNYGEEWQ